VPKISDEKRDELRAEHGAGVLHVLPDPDEYERDDSEIDEIIVRGPKRAEYKRFRAALDDDKKIAKAAEQLLRDCLVHPTKDELAEMLSRRPGLEDTWGQALARLAGVRQGVEAKKL
jgi:hypothetical protein